MQANANKMAGKYFCNNKTKGNANKYNNVLPSKLCVVFPCGKIKK